jgi:lipopolysaccharide/colanic/teichoic acid biosynthesis glycosyltransferase
VNRDGFADVVVTERRERFRQVCTRIIDVATAALCLALLAPLLGLVVVLKMALSRPLFVRERRYGYRNRPILIWRFRTSSALEQEMGNQTWVDHFLQQTGINDLPMLVNVLRGEMSIIGPPPNVRPDIALNDRKPGLAPWANLLNAENDPQ